MGWGVKRVMEAKKDREKERVGKLRLALPSWREGGKEWRAGGGRREEEARETRV